MNRFTALFFAVVIVLTAAHRSPAPILEKPTPANRQQEDADSKSKTRANSTSKFDGTWVATITQPTEPPDRNATYTIVIKDKKTAIKTMDITFTLPPDDPFYQTTHELRAIWTSYAAELIVENSSVTIQWSALRLSSWSPKNIPKEVVETRAPPGAGVSVYVLNEDGLTRINPAEGVTYRHVK